MNLNSIERMRGWQWMYFVCREEKRMGNMGILLIFISEDQTPRKRSFCTLNSSLCHRHSSSSIKQECAQRATIRVQGGGDKKFGSIFQVGSSSSPFIIWMHERGKFIVETKRFYSSSCVSIEKLSANDH